MKVTDVSSMKDGTKIQIEDWHDDFNFFEENSTLAAYPISKVNQKGQFAPKMNRTFRLSFNFSTEEETQQAFIDLKIGAKQLIDFKDQLNNPEKIECI